MNQAPPLVACVSSPPTKARFSWLEKLTLLGLGLLLFGLGQFDAVVFAGLSFGWQVLVASLGGAPSGVLPGASGLSTHALPVALSYRLLYTGVSLYFLHVALRGRGTKWLASGYAVVLTVSMLLLLLGQRTGSTFASAQAHRLLDLVCSPLAFLGSYVILMVYHRPLPR